MSFGNIRSWQAIRTLEDVRDVIAQVLAIADQNGVEGSTDDLLFSFIKSNEFGYCGDCERVHEDDPDPPMRDGYDDR